MRKLPPRTILALFALVVGIWLTTACSAVPAATSGAGGGSSGSGAGDGGSGGTGGTAEPAAPVVAAGRAEVEAEAWQSSGSGGTADFYIAPNGNDAWSGTLAAPNTGSTDGPFATVAKAQTAVQGILNNPQGRTRGRLLFNSARAHTLSRSLVVHHGRFRYVATSSQLGKLSAENPVISGGVQLKRFRLKLVQNISGNEWQVSLPASTQYFEQLFYNQERRLRPRLGGSLGTYYGVAATVYLSGSSSDLRPIQTARSMSAEADGNASTVFNTLPPIPSARAGRI